MNPEAWLALARAFLDRADTLGVSGRRLILAFLAGLAAYMMVHGVSPLWCIVFVAIIYTLEPIVEIAVMLIHQRNKNSHLAIERNAFRQYVGRRRRRFTNAEPELPLPAPPGGGEREGDGT